MPVKRIASAVGQGVMPRDIRELLPWIILKWCLKTKRESRVDRRQGGESRLRGLQLIIKLFCAWADGSHCEAAESHR